MREVAGAILILAGSVLVAGGMLTNAITRGHEGEVGYGFGAIAGLAGIVMLFGGVVRRAWDAIPTDGESSGK